MKINYKVKRIGVTINILIVIFIASGGVCYSGEENKIMVILRYDDYSNGTSLEIEKEIFQVTKELDMKMTIGIIPFSDSKGLGEKYVDETMILNDQKQELLRKAIQNGNIEIALHGYRHFVSKKTRQGFLTEFYGIEYEKQLKMIKAGKESLEKIFGRSVHTFIPPWNTFDHNTIRALGELKFKIISTDAMPSVITTELENRETGNIKILPATCNLSEIEETIEHANKNIKTENVIIVLMHPYDLQGKGSYREGINGPFSFHKMKKLLSELNRKQGVFITNVENATEDIKDLNKERYIKYSKYRNAILYLPHKLYPQIPTIYYPKNKLDSLNRKVSWLLAMYYSGIAFCGITFGYLLGKRLFGNNRKILNIVKVSMSILFIILIIYGMRDLNLAPKGTLILAIIGSFYIGILAVKRKKEQIN